MVAGMTEPNLLGNELVRKYFSSVPCDHGDSTESPACAGCMAYFVLQAMQQPIKQGERYLRIEMPGGEIPDEIGSTGIPIALHPLFLRLPDRFQEQPSEPDHCGHIEHWGVKSWCDRPKPDPPKCDHGAGFVCAVCWPEPKPDEVEEKIQSIVAPFVRGGDKIEKELRSLVSLAEKRAREGK